MIQPKEQTCACGPQEADDDFKMHLDAETRRQSAGLISHGRELTARGSRMWFRRSGPGLALHCALCLSWMLAFMLPAVSSADADPPAWWNGDWSGRLALTVDAGPGDVAWARVPLAGRAADDAGDLRLIDESGNWRNFQIIHHDPLASSLIHFRVEPNNAQTLWLYFSNDRAPRVNTINPGLADRQKAWAKWKTGQVERNAALRRKAALTDQRDQLQAQLRRLEQRQPDPTDQSADSPVGDAQADPAPPPRAPDPRIGQLTGRINQLQSQIDRIKPPPAQPEPQVPASWSAQRGVLLEIYRKARSEHPSNLRALLRLIADSKLEGAGYRDGISDGFNPFGTSENYISMYDGYLRIDAPGEYAFCTVSDDGSWIIVNDKLIHAWPGGHGYDGSQRGERHGNIKLSKGTAHIRYLHEEGGGDQLAYMAWRPPGNEKFVPIPKAQWLPVRQADIRRVQSRDKKPLALAQVDVVDTYWIRDTDDQQATQVRFRALGLDQAKTRYQVHWQFGDGLEQTGTDVRHIYFRNGRPRVTMTLRRGDKVIDKLICSPNIFQVDVVASYYSRARASDYAKAARDYDVKRMDREDLHLYTEFWARLDRHHQQARAAMAFVERFADDPAVVDLALEAAEATLSNQAYQPALGERLLTRALDASGDAPRPRLQLKLAELRTWHLDKPDQAGKLFTTLHEAHFNSKDRQMLRIGRLASIGLGDVAIMQGRFEDAARHYQAAQEITERSIKDSEKAAKIGSYPYIVEDLLARGENEWALRALDQWEDQFPLQKLEGLSFFLRGKVLFVDQPGELALEYLDLAERVSPTALHVPEAVWLRANCLMAMKRYEKALGQLQRIRSDFTQSIYYHQAPEKIEQCQAAIDKTRS